MYYIWQVQIKKSGSNKGTHGKTLRLPEYNKGAKLESTKVKVKVLI